MNLVQTVSGIKKIIINQLHSNNFKEISCHIATNEKTNALLIIGLLLPPSGM